MPRLADPALEDLWRRRLRQQPDSGLTIRQFCKKEGISTANFHSWKRRLALRTASPTTFSPGASAFVPVIIPPATNSQPQLSAEHVTIRLANGGQILLPVTAGAEMVCQVVKTVAYTSARTEDPS